MLGAILQLASGAMGFAGRFAPDMIGKWMESRQEKKNMEMQLLIEKERRAGAKDIKMMDREALEAVNAVQLEIAGLSERVKNIDSARSFGLKLGSMMDQTLSRGKKLGIHPVVLNLCFLMVMFVEAGSAIVQPAIAVCVFTIWMFCKIKKGDWTFGTEDWMLMDAIVGFFLAGRVKKHQDIKDKAEDC